MASPTATVYPTAPHGGTIYGGRAAPVVDARPSWVLAAAINTWGTVPGNTLASINPENDPTVNPNYPAASPWRGSTGQSSMVSAWSGGCFDPVTCTFHEPLQEGHNDGACNAPYRVGLKAEVANFEYYRRPSGAIGNVFDLTAAEGTGYYLDGRLRACHSYNNNVFVPGLGPVVTRTIGHYPSGSTGMNKAFVINQVTGEASLLSDHTAASGGGGGYGGGAYDAARGVIWMLGTGTAPLVKINTATGVASAVKSADNYAFDARLVMLDEYDLLLVVQTGGAGYQAPIFAFDLLTTPPAIVPINYTGSFSSGLPIAGYTGADWNATAKELLLWGNATNRVEVSVLHIPTDPRTGNCTAGVKTVAAENTVTPTAAAVNGTYGRFFHSTLLGCCFVLNAVDQPIYFFRLE